MTGTLRYAAIGDSIPRGFLMGRPRHIPPGACTTPAARLLRWFDRPDRGYPALVAESLRAAGCPVDLDVSLTCSGARTSTFWRTGPTPALGDALRRRTDMVTVTVGANDLMAHWAAYVPAAVLLRTAAAPLTLDPQRVLDRLAPQEAWCEAAITRIGTRLRGLLGWLGEHAAGPVLVTTYYPVDESDVVHTRFVRPVNAAIRAAAAGLPGVRLVDLERTFRGHGSAAAEGERWVSARDHLHPTRAGQRAIADAVLACVPELAGHAEAIGPGGAG